jgi:hypothetical protein
LTVALFRGFVQESLLACQERGSIRWSWSSGVFGSRWRASVRSAAGLETNDKEVRRFAAAAVNEVINEGFMGFAEGNSVPHGSGSHSVAGGVRVPGFIAYLKRMAPEDEEGRLEAFDEIVQRFVDLTTAAEAAEIGPLMNTN